jgi:alkylation response protein AidB-like acyl-CoA dehydrogenase
MKRTYNLRPTTVDTVRRLVEAQVAPTQDALVERAVRDLAREFRDALHTHAWAQSREDRQFQAELQEIWAGLEADDRLAWGVDDG